MTPLLLARFGDTHDVYRPTPSGRLLWLQTPSYERPHRIDPRSRFILGAVGMLVKNVLALRGMMGAQRESLWRLF